MSDYRIDHKIIITLLKQDTKKNLNNELPYLSSSLDETRTLHERVTMSEETRHKLSLEREDHLRQIEQLNHERNSLIESGRKTQKETDLMRQEWDEHRLTHERLRFVNLLRQYNSNRTYIQK